MPDVYKVIPTTLNLRSKPLVPVAPAYGSTVSELNANSPNNWFAEFGTDFGWRRTLDLNALQNAANQGSVCISSDQRSDLERPGHIVAVVPERQPGGRPEAAGVVIRPLQSHAGASNFKYGGSVWWTSDKFRSFSYWIHD